MKFYDPLIQIYKKLQEGTLSVYIETDISKKYHVTSKDHHITFHTFDSREKAIEFCRFLNINILAYITHK